MRVVLDTNVVISALLFRGTAARLVPLWQRGRIVPLLTGPMLEEYLRALAYPKFRLTEDEIRGLVEEELLPFARPVTVRRRLRVVGRDPDDDKFIECAVSGRARFLITGDLDLRSVGSYRKVLIVTPGEFLRAIGSTPEAL